MRLFKAKGYEATHNVHLVGRSGVDHQLDLLVRLVSPLHTTTIVVEAKSYEGGVDKDRIMKLIQVVSDIGADRGILVTTSHFTPAALKTAEGFNIDLWDHDKLAQLIGEIELSGLEIAESSTPNVAEGAIKSRLSVPQIQESLNKRTEQRARGFLGVGKVSEELTRCVLTYYPYYDVQLEVQTQEEQRVGIFKREAIQKASTKAVSVDAVLGCLVEAGVKGIGYDFFYLATLTPDELTVHQSVGPKPFDPSPLAAVLGVSDGRLKKALNGLLAKGCISKTSVRPTTYQAAKVFPHNPLAVRSILDEFPSQDAIAPSADRYGGVVKEAGAVTKALESYWRSAKVQTIRLLYYPFVIAFFRRADGSSRIEVVDAVTGEPNQTLAGLPWKAEEVPADSTGT